MLRKKIPLILILVLAFGLFATACGGSKTQNGPSPYELAPMTDMPMEVQSAPEIVRTAYQFAFANPDVLTNLPCYCGCGGMGHTSNYACYVAAENDNGTLSFDNHALGCSICVDITIDAMYMLEDGKSLPEIRMFVDQTYSAFGPSNMP